MLISVMSLDLDFMKLANKLYSFTMILIPNFTKMIFSCVS
jgi:hypothetical protein